MGGQNSKAEDKGEEDVKSTDQAEQDDCSCPTDHNPKEEESVCGSDGLTYPSMLQFECAAKRDKTLKLKWLGPCESPAVRKDVVDYILKNPPKISATENLGHAHGHAHNQNHSHSHSHSHSHCHSHDKSKNIPENKSDDGKSTPNK